MNILLISRCPPYPLHLGDRLIPYHLARELTGRGHQIDLLAFTNLPDDTAQTSHYADLFRSVQLIPEPRRGAAAYGYRLLNHRAFFPTRAADSWSPEMWEAITRALSAHHYDVVQLFGGIQVYEYRDLVRSRPNLIVPYESFSLYLKRLLQQEHNPVRQLLVRAQLTVAQRYEKSMFAGFSGVVVLSEPDKHMLHALNPRLPLRVIPNGVDTGYFDPRDAAQADSPILIFVGNFEYAPNVDAASWLVQDIFPRVIEHLPEARLVLVGNNPPEALRGLSSASVEVTGRVPDVRPYLKRAMIFVCPLRFGAGIKNKVLEAMAMQKPLVGTRLSCDGISLTEGINVIYGKTADELSAAILRLAADPALRQQMATANRQFVEAAYTWTRVADQYEALYAQIIARWADSRPDQKSADSALES